MAELPSTQQKTLKVLESESPFSTPSSSLVLKKKLIQQTNCLITYLNGVSGRDKLYRTIQYALRLVSWLLQKAHPTNIFSTPFNQIASGFSSGRRFIRIGNIPSTLQGMYNSWKNEMDTYILWCQVLNKLCGLGFLFLNHASWVSRQGLFKMDYDYWSIYDSMCWLGCIICSVLADFHQLRITVDKLSVLENSLHQKDLSDEHRMQALSQINTLNNKKRNLYLNFLRNFADLPVALNGINKWNQAPAVIWHFCGTVSSLIGVYQGWPSPPK